MAFLVHTFAILYQQYLRRLMRYAEQLCHLIGYGAVADQVELIEFDIGGCSCTLKPAFCHAADTTAGAVLEDDNRLILTRLSYFFQLCFVGQFYPIHSCKITIQMPILPSILFIPI